MTHDEKIELIRNVPDEYKEIALKASLAFVESLRDQLHEEHGESWRTRAQTVESAYVSRFVERFVAKLVRL